NTEINQSTANSQQRQHTVTSGEPKITAFSHQIEQFTDQLRATIDRFKQLGKQLQTTARRVTEFIKSKTHPQLNTPTQPQNKQTVPTESATKPDKKPTKEFDLNTDKSPEELIAIFKNFNQKVDQENAQKEHEKALANKQAQAAKDRQNKELKAKRIREREREKEQQQNHGMGGPTR